MPYTKPRIRLTTATTTLWMSKEFETMKKEKMIQMIAQERSKLGLSTYAAAEKA